MSEPVINAFALPRAGETSDGGSCMPADAQPQMIQMPAALVNALADTLIERINELQGADVRLTAERNRVHREMQRIRTQLAGLGIGGI